MRRLRLLLCCLVGTTTASAGQLEPAPVLALERWLAAYNSGKPEVIETYLRESYPARLPKLEFERANRAQSGGYDLREVSSADERQATGLLQERNSDQFVEFEIVVAGEPPGRIQSLRLRMVERPERYPIARLDEAGAVREAGRFAQEQAHQEKFSGVVTLARRDRILFEQAYGLQDRAHGVPNSLDTRFRLGSMNKMFTAVAVMQLVQSGRVKLDAPLGTYLPDYPDPATRAITIHQLLTHTGGTGDIFGPEFDVKREQLRDVADYLALYGSRPPAFPAGSRYEYSNYGYVLLGAVIERVSGDTYYDYVEKHVYRPAGMSASGSEPESTQVPARAVGYMFDAHTMQWQPNTDTLPFRGSPAGGGYSTARDLVRFANALLDHRLLDEAHTNLLLDGKVDAGGFRYAYGFGDYREQRGWVGHNGGAPGMNGDLRIYPASGYIVVALANVDPFIASKVADFVDARLPVAQ